MVHPTWYDPVAGVVQVASLVPDDPRALASLARSRAVMQPFVVLG